MVCALVTGVQTGALPFSERLLAVGVLGVLGAVALGRGGGEGPDHFGAAHPPQVVELGFQPRVPGRGDQSGALLARRAPASHGVPVSAPPARAAGCSPGRFRSDCRRCRASAARSEEHTSELQSLMRISYAVLYTKKKN